MGLPFSMDTVGTILGASLLPWHYTILVAALSSVLASVLINPIFVYYTMTQIIIGLAALALVRVNAFSQLYQAILSGLLIGIISAIVSAPVTALVFGGIARPSISVLNIWFLSSGKTLWQSVISGALIVESIDKVASGIIVWHTLRRLRSTK